jgi:hypothetical protein
MLSSASVSYPLDKYVALWVCMLSSDSLCFPLVCYPLERYVVLRVGMLSSESLYYHLSSGFECYPLDILCYPLSCPPGPYVIL